MNGVELDAAVEQSIRGALGTIEDDEIGIGLSGIVAGGRLTFGLRDEDLPIFLRRVIAGLVASGATPADDRFFSPDNPQGLAHFGADTPQEVADGIVTDWVAAGMPRLGWGDWRFNTVENRACLDEVAAETRALRANRTV